MVGTLIAPPRNPPRPDELEALIREARARQRRRRLFAAVIVAGAAAAAVAVWAARPSARNAAAPPTSRVRGSVVARCLPEALRISLPRRFAGLGHLNGDLRFTNTSGGRCLLSGWPKVLAVEPDGKAIRAMRIRHLWEAWALNWPRARRERAVVLGRGRSADVEIDGGDVPVGNEPTPCPTALWLRVTPPGGGRPTKISAVWWTSAGRPVYYSLCAGIAVTSFFPPSVLPH